MYSQATFVTTLRLAGLKPACGYGPGKEGTQGFCCAPGMPAQRFARRQKQDPSKKPQTRQNEVTHPQPTGFTRILERGIHTRATIASINL